MANIQSSDLPVRFGSVIRRKRLKLGWTQEELAERAGLDRSFVANIEQGKRNVSLITVEKIANALDLSIQALFRGL
jgi:transcriptional regulator with XRE-family HTH domain